MHALALIVFVSYFASLFFTVRVFVYHRAALALWEPDRGVLTRQYTRMARRVWSFIAWPSLIGMGVCGVVTLYLRPDLLSRSWTQALLGLAALLVVYHVANQRLLGRLERHESVWSTFRMRLWGQGATLLLAGFAAILTMRELAWYYGVLGLVVLGAVLVVVLRAGGKKDEADASSGKPGA